MVRGSELAANHGIWIVSYSCAMIVLLIGSIYLMFFGQKQRKSIKAVGVLFVSILFLQFPIYFEMRDYSLFEAVFGSFLTSVSMMKGKEYMPVVIDGAPVFSVVFSYTLLVIQILVLFATAGALLSLFRTPIQVFRAYCSKGKEIYIFSGYNNKTYSVAESLKGKPGRKLLFTNCGGLKSGDIDKINQIDGIYLKGDFANVSLKMAGMCKKRKICLFIFSESESENIYTLSALSQTFAEFKKDISIRVYVELLDTAWDEQDVINLQNKFNDNIIVNYVRVADNFAINNLYRNSIFENAILENGIYNIKILIVGVDEYSYAMIRHVLALGQMPKYFVQVSVIDSGNGYDVLKKQFPELCEYMNEEGNAKYAFSYHENINPNTYSFEKLIESKYSDFTFCFVNMGDDVQNHAVVSALNRIRYRCENTEQCTIQVRDIRKDNYLEHHSCYEHMQAVGDFGELYSYENIAESTIEEVTRKIHEVRQKSKAEQKGVSWEGYANNEYNRRSTYSRTLSIKYKLLIPIYNHKKSFDALSPKLFL